VPIAQWTLVEAHLDPVQDSEQGGARPVLIVSNNEFNRAIPNVTVLPVTSTQRRLYPSEVALPQGAAGQRLDSIVMAHQIRTISQRRLGRQLGTLADPDLRRAVQQAIKEHLDLA
jgi:mRNA interferase MazF